MTAQWTDEQIELMRKHTPGRWAVHNSMVVASNMPPKVYGTNGEYSHPYIVAQPHLYTQVELNSEELAANCALIAAAPELLEKCLQMQAEIAYLREWLRGEVTTTDVDIDIMMRCDGIEPCPRPKGASGT